jgi:DNA-directed RNA polymerase specialized sigma24 family protein
MAANSSHPNALPGPPAEGAADLALARAALAGAREVGPKLVDRLSALPAMIRLKHKRLGGHLDATELEDVLQSTLLAVWRKLDRYDGRVRLLHWAYGFAVFELLKAI